MAPWLSAKIDPLLRRKLRTVTQTEGSTLWVDGQAYLSFSSNDYLGYARHPRVIAAAKEVLDHWGVGATSSRLISGTSINHQDLESALAAFLGQESALVFPSGYMTNLGVVTSLVGPGDAIVADRLCHASLIDAARLSGARLLVYKHADAGEAEKALKRAQSFRHRLLVTESLFSMDGDLAPLDELLDLAGRYDAISLVDEAHALGVFGAGFVRKGERAKGRKGDVIFADSPIRPLADATVVVGTLSKALGSQGGFVAGSHDLIDTLINKARSFIFTTGLSPVCVAAAHAALSLVQEEEAPRTRVLRLATRLRESLNKEGWNTLKSVSHIVPLRIGEVEETLRLAEALWQKGIYAPAIRPPTVHAGECRLRFSITAEHQDADIDRLLTVLKESI